MCASLIIVQFVIATSKQYIGKGAKRSLDVARAAIRIDDYVRSHSLEGRESRDARRRAPLDDIDFVLHPPLIRTSPPYSASDLECSPLAPIEHLRQKLRLRDTTAQFKIPLLRLAVTNLPAVPNGLSGRKSLGRDYNDAAGVHAVWKNKLFVTIKMVNQTNFSNCEVKHWSSGAHWWRTFKRIWLLKGLYFRWCFSLHRCWNIFNVCFYEIRLYTYLYWVLIIMYIYVYINRNLF